MKPARTRIAPSPTGYMHVGTLRTALFSYFLAHQTGGQFILRIEDTDRTRFVEGATESLIKTFKDLGIEFDEGPFVQSERLTEYKIHADRLLADSNAYYCFCSRDRLEEMRKQQQETKQTPKYDRACLKLTSDEIQKKLDSGENHVIRMKIPEGETIVKDLVRGNVKFNHSDIDDQVIVKSDGYPTYHLAVVVDDFLMNITHVIRGEEWLPSTPKHIILQKMFDFDIPQFAHVPLLLNPDKTKLSKRQGDVAVEDYLKKGYLPQALINFISTLGYNPTGDREVYTMQELIDLFDITKVKSSGAVMNIEKLDWMNNHYIKELSDEELFVMAKPFLSMEIDKTIQKALLIERERVNRLEELEEKITPYLKATSYAKESLIWKKADALDAKKNLEGVLGVIENLNDPDFDKIETLEGEVKKYIEREGLQNGNVLWPLRVALSGQEKSASPFELLWVFGREQGIERIKKAISLL
ncbi:glutamate--tRNA ligase [Candidatus Uhrbacteria bacterium CG_4_9_14_0_2_um_filter_41_50]|uniref:Glutamate--tRNA ligase n=1 Tax=Candidatus Uhrbacteria bacterium CG_4_9_14_0_2_um_filter_41_50 TaxID=1975031 RepID=A0A2M8EN50_9BACT|nr:MAG: glutamate--tRNA ligase [Candidatus Uhrbacteria bacterium CG_4_10_14_3_um_filter_41_21]PIZ54344.1 MAG: glutamate--tRNA ligase [Candidatus Uhrbacteria bacterium CG_4_10_14_0_2_um_filter_41_21]PJB84680.1 MAG: glutamate--tRNA ligase [Candidatus Uhrbacteria bacterium CG_4_9_14_0_8_um_filter_41_16]PJC24166.1 MAG: glutamate--tRNA ligase [Candidatus Uhrbacteria bacterium CG_4_9_14_0_2_um_filter_41_50]PJE75081.1 MAG: glutamate--tRNA ligase [Candidatus Uhrbacteria bacterium CG10_big_fil_rev_8_21_